MNKKLMNNLLLFLGGILIVGMISIWKKYEITKNHGFTSAIVTGTIDGTKGTNYVAFKYVIQDTEYKSKNSLTRFVKKRRIVPIVGKEYLLMYSKNNALRSHLINIETDYGLGIDLSEQYSLDSLEQIGLIPLAF